jgi:hypothetical protein
MATKKTARPTVKRGADGKMVSLKPAPGPISGLPEFVGKNKPANAVPVRPTRKRKATRSGKKLTAEGTVAVPTVTREGGKLRGTTAEERKAAVTTELPATPVEPAAPRSSGSARVYKGAGAAPIKTGAAQGKHSQIKALTDHAVTLLGRMQETHGTEAYHDHHAEFNMVHATIGQMSPHIHGILGLAKGFVHNPSEKSAKGLIETQKALHARLSIIKAVETDRQTRRDANRPQGE